MVGNKLMGLLALAAVAVPGGAMAVIRSGASSGNDLPPYLQCVPYARRVTGINIYGDAHTWWSQAAGRYARGSVPKVGAVMSFRAGGNSHLGHVAAVSRIVDSRTVLISHANWSPINGRRGQIERNVEAVDVSPNNDWSEVRVWFAPIHALGGKRWALNGFIYNQKPGWKPGKIEKPKVFDTEDDNDDVELVTPTKKAKDKEKAKFASGKSFAKTVKIMYEDVPLTSKVLKRGKISDDFGEDLIGEIIAKKRQLSKKKR